MNTLDQAGEERQQNTAEQECLMDASEQETGTGWQWQQQTGTGWKQTGSEQAPEECRQWLAAGSPAAMKTEAESDKPRHTHADGPGADAKAETK